MRYYDEAGEITPEMLAFLKQRISAQKEQRTMTKAEALALIDKHKNSLVNPIEMLNWTWLRVIILKIPDELWEEAVTSATIVIAG